MAVAPGPRRICVGAMYLAKDKTPEVSCQAAFNGSGVEQAVVRSPAGRGLRARGLRKAAARRAPQCCVARVGKFDERFAKWVVRVSP